MASGRTVPSRGVGGPSCRAVQRCSRPVQRWSSNGLTKQQCRGDSSFRRVRDWRICDDSDWRRYVDDVPGFCCHEAGPRSLSGQATPPGLISFSSTGTSSVSRLHGCWVLSQALTSSSKAQSVGNEWQKNRGEREEKKNGRYAANVDELPC